MTYEQLQTKISLTSTIKISHTFLVKSIEPSPLRYSEPYSESFLQSFMKFTHRSFGTSCWHGVDNRS